MAIKTGKFRKPVLSTLIAKHKAFTLVEAVVILVLVCLFYALLIPATTRVRGPCRRSACLSNARQIGLAFKQYAIDNNDQFPWIGASSNSVTSSSVFATLTNGCYLSIGKIYICPQDKGKVTGTSGLFGAANNSYACVVSNSSGLHGLSETNSSDNPLILDAHLKGAPGYVVNLTNAKWNSNASHGGGDGGNIFYVGGQAAFKKTFDTGTDGTDGFIVEP